VRGAGRGMGVRCGAPWWAGARAAALPGVRLACVGHLTSFSRGFFERPQIEHNKIEPQAALEVTKIAPSVAAVGPCPMCDPSLMLSSTPCRTGLTISTGSSANENMATLSAVSALQVRGRRRRRLLSLCC